MLFVDWIRLLVMDWKVFLTIFAAVFIAELGDKTQLATMLFATDKEVSKYTIFLAASAALIVATALGVLAGTLLSEYINERYLHYIAGVGFIGIGIFTLYNA
jgi:putative Ca2+/H+ antiporter (TMEM165/GDT1 family)